MNRRLGNLYVEGIRSPRGTKYIKVESGKSKGLAPALTFTVDERKAKLILAHQGIIIPGATWGQVQRDIAGLDRYPVHELAERPGWNNGNFVLPNGEVISPEGAPVPMIAFETDPEIYGVGGSLQGWIEGVAEPLQGQSLGMTIMMAGFASSLVELVERDENYGLEIVGDPHCGKSDIQRLLASMCGSGSLRTFNSTLDGLEEYIELTNGLVFNIDEANLFYADDAPQRRGPKLKAMAFRLADGKIKLRHKGPKPERYFFVFVTSTNEPMIRHTVSEHYAVAKATSDRLLTLEVAKSRPHGVFDFVPKGFADAEELATSMQAAAKANYGHPMRTYLAGLVKDLADDRQAVIARIKANIGIWRARAGDITGRVGNAFGLLYAAGEEAKRYGALPASWACGKAVEAVYRNFYTGPKAPRDFDTVLREVLAQPKVRDIDERGLRPMGQKLFEAHTAFVRTNEKGEQEAIFYPPTIDREIKGWEPRIATSKAGVRLNNDKGRRTNKRTVRTGKTERMVVLTLPKGFLKKPA